MNQEKIIIEKLIPGGMGLGKLSDGKKIFLWNTLVGEEVVQFIITKNKTHYAEGVAVKINNPSPFRLKPQDDCFLSTSPWQIMDYNYELTQKQELLVEIFREHGIDIEKPEIVTDGRDYFYRNKMEYALYWNKETEKIELAFHARGSHQKIPIQSSSLERPEIFQKAQAIIADLNARNEEARKYQSLLLRANQNGEVSGGLYENHRPHPAFNNLTDKILDRSYSYSPNGFFQINLPVYELALQEIQKHVKTTKVLDLYSGVGTIGLSVARGKQLTLVEVDKSAFFELKKNCAEEFEASLGYPQPILAKSEEVLDYVEPDQTVILDPPRAGCDQKLLEKLNEIKPTTIIYLSCNPATQARDIKLLLENYQIKIIKAFNFFPRTPHIENLVVLTQK